MWEICSVVLVTVRQIFDLRHDSGSNNSSLVLLEVIILEAWFFMLEVIIMMIFHKVVFVQNQ